MQDQFILLTTQHLSRLLHKILSGYFFFFCRIYLINQQITQLLTFILTETFYEKLLIDWL